MNNVIKTLSLAILAACYLANTLAVYGAEYGGHNVCMGNFCYHIAQDKESGL